MSSFIKRPESPANSKGAQRLDEGRRFLLGLGTDPIPEKKLDFGELLYCIAASRTGNTLLLRILRRNTRKNASNVLIPISYESFQSEVSDDPDYTFVRLLGRAVRADNGSASFELDPAMAEALLPRLSAEGLLFWFTSPSGAYESEGFADEDLEPCLYQPAGHFEVGLNYGEGDEYEDAITLTTVFRTGDGTELPETLETFQIHWCTWTHPPRALFVPPDRAESADPNLDTAEIKLPEIKLTAPPDQELEILLPQRTLSMLKNAPVEWLWQFQRTGLDAIKMPRALAPLLALQLEQHRSYLIRPLPYRFRFQVRHTRPKAMVRVQEDGELLQLELHYIYVQSQVLSTDVRVEIVDDKNRVVIPRDFHAEENMRLKLAGIEGINADLRSHSFSIQPKELLPIVEQLFEAGFLVDGSNIELPLAKKLEVHFEDEGRTNAISKKVTIDGTIVAIADLEKNIRARKPLVKLKDGKTLLLRPEWFDQLEEVVSALKNPSDAPSLRLAFVEGQAEGLSINWQNEARSFRERLLEIGPKGPENAPETFHGTLRQYQESSLGWFRWLEELKCGGCLADEMGLGKTVQVLALWAREYTLGEDGKPLSAKAKQAPKKPSLLVVPKSLVGNWQAEAARFVPELKVSTLSGKNRTIDPDTHVVIITYGVLLRSIQYLAGIDFRYVVLDEAHTIKNPKASTTRAALVLKADLRLALTGTPVENRAGDFASLLAFLNPPLRQSTFITTALQSRQDLPGETLIALQSATKTFVLRRTKAEVAAELPARTEQSLICELSDSERARYDYVRSVYVEKLFGTKAPEERRTMHILEAMLRLRQLACHSLLPGWKHAADLEEAEKVSSALLSFEGAAPLPAFKPRARKTDAGDMAEEVESTLISTKIAVLIERLLELRESGERALVFSQFTSFLDLASKALVEAGVRHGILHGGTENRQQVVENWKRDEDATAFLISLKAGGVGLNLTEASYVFLLDPWWNPAAEAQAIDRTHRIGQEKPVTAYRIIARDTIEERVLELQQKKMELVKDLLGGDSQVLSKLTHDEIRRLFS